jgi:antirestriction protein ArdC
MTIAFKTNATEAVTPTQNGKFDLYQIITETILQQLERGVIPWQKPWAGDAMPNFSIPINFSSGKKYRGINIIMLWGAAKQNNFSSNEWATLKEWNGKGETIKCKETGHMILLFDIKQKPNEHGEQVKSYILKYAKVFNRCQLKSFDPATIETPHKTVGLVERHYAADLFFTNTKAEITYGADQASYNQEEDKITIPPLESFSDTATGTATDYLYTTTAQQLIDWTGHSSRLNRDLRKKFGDKTYAMEELIAELGAAFLCADLGISHVSKGEQASYIASWIELLQDNKRTLFAAAKEATLATEYLHSLQPKLN